MTTAVVFDSAGTLLHTYRVAKDIVNNKIVEGVETTTLTCSARGRALILLYAHSQNIINASGEELLSSYLKNKNIKFGVACSCGVVTMSEISDILYSDNNAKVADLQTCIKSVWSCCRKLPVVAMNSGVIVNKNINRIEYAITSGGRPFSGAKKTIQTLQEMDIATYLHEKLCTYNHTDGCDWYYDDGSWNRHSRTAYIKKAINFLQKGYTLQEIKDFYDTLNS